MVKYDIRLQNNTANLKHAKTLKLKFDTTGNWILVQLDTEQKREYEAGSFTRTQWMKRNGFL